MAAIIEVFHKYNAVRIGNGRGAEALVSTQGARPLAFWPKGQSGRFSTLFTNPEKPARSTHACWPNFSRLSLKGDGSDAILDERGIKAQGGMYGQYSLKKYGIDNEVRTLPIHGPSRTSEWNIVKNEQYMVVMEYDHQADERTFPFDARLTALASIDNNGRFFYSMTATNLSPLPMPMDLAIHTYLPWEKGMSIVGLRGLKFFEGTDWARNNPGSIQQMEMRFDELTSLEKHCILPDCLPPLVLSFPESDRIVMYSFSGSPKEMVLWANPDEGSFLCAEPILRGRNCLNSDNAIILEPGNITGLGFSMQIMGEEDK